MLILQLSWNVRRNFCLLHKVKQINLRQNLLYYSRNSEIQKNAYGKGTRQINRAETNDEFSALYCKKGLDAVWYYHSSRRQENGDVDEGAGGG